VRVKDAAIIAAATLSHRYITDRFLPDKAIDLIDEAAAALRMQLDSLPVEIDEVERHILQLEIERQALLKEDDAHSRERLAQLDQQLAGLREQSNASKARWQVEKDAIAGIGKQKAQIDSLKAEEQRYERAGELAKVAEIRYGKLAQAEHELQEAQKRLADLQKSGRMLKEEVDEEDIAALVSKWTGIPVGRLLEGEARKLVSMEERLRQRVVGQEDALERVSNAIRRNRAGLSDPNRPIGSFIFLGPTGVGKTELARALAEFLFDDGRLTDGKGRKVDFRNTVLVMTSNVGSAALFELAGKDPERARKEATEALRATFRPEFLNRIDDIVLFNPLGREQLEKIVDLQLASVSKLLAERQVRIELTPAARALVLSEGYDPA